MARVTGKPNVLLLYLKAFHIVFVVTWFAGLFYLPRLFVYHADCADDASRSRFVVMERRLFGIMTIGGALALVFGTAMLLVAHQYSPPGYLAFGWMQVKLVLVALLLGYHVACHRCLVAFRCERNSRSARWYRWFNEAPGLLLIAIVLLAVLKPF
jgi:putative membrane protein